MNLGKRFLIISIIVAIITSIISCLVIIERQKIKEFKLEAMPYKVEYYIGEDIELDGIILKAYKKNNKNYIVNINSIEITGFESNMVGTKTVSIKYKGFEVQFNVAVVDFPVETPRVIGIEIDREPIKKIYKVGESINLSGGIIKLLYSDGSTKKLAIIKDYIVDFDSTIACDEYRVNIAYKDSLTNETFFAYFIITIED